METYEFYKRVHQGPNLLRCQERFAEEATFSSRLSLSAVTLLKARGKAEETTSNPLES